MMFQLLLCASLMISYAYGTACCIVHSTEDACNAEETNTCVWLDDNDPLFTSGDSQGIQCVSNVFVECQNNGICPPPPTVTFTDECILSACENNNEKVNVAIVIDESGSVGKTNYLVSLDFVKRMVRDSINDISPVSMLAFASGLDRIHHFSTDKSNLFDAIEQERQDYNGGGTCTSTALREAMNEFENSPHVAPGDNNILILMTDGQPNCGGNVCDEAQPLVDLGIDLYILGIGNGFTKGPVACLVQDQSRILTIPEFTPRLFYRLESQLRQVVCPSVFVDEYGFGFDFMTEFGTEQEQFVIGQSEQTVGPNHDHVQMVFWLSLVSFILAGIAYYAKGFLGKARKGLNGGYEPLVEAKKQMQHYNTV